MLQFEVMKVSNRDKLRELIETLSEDEIVTLLERAEEIKKNERRLSRPVRNIYVGRFPDVIGGIGTYESEE